MLGFRSFLVRVEEAVPAGGREGPIPFVTYGAFRVIDADYGNANRIAATAFELDHLVPEIVYYAVYLLDHRLGQHLHFDANFYRRDGASGDEVAVVCDG